MSATTNLPRNRLLLALPSSNLKQLMPELEPIRCDREQILMDADSSLDHVFFPDSGVVSAVAVYSDGRIIETATIGREGCTNVQVALGAKRSSVRLLVQIPGSPQKMARGTFVRAIGTMPSFRNLMYAYTQAFLEQVLVSVACNGAHSLRERLARSRKSYYSPLQRIRRPTPYLRTWLIDRTWAARASLSKTAPASTPSKLDRIKRMSILS
jgi:hypothetical protein